MRFTAVKTTGIFCRPGCPGRPKPGNTEPFTAPGAALLAGYRPCKRCRPLDDPARPSRGETAVYLAPVETPLGTMIAAASDQHLLLLEFAARRMLLTQFRRVGRTAAPDYRLADNALTRRVRRQLAGYFAGTRRDFDIPLAAPGTPFQELVWRALRRIPPGATRSYAQLARAIGRPSAVRAVARANGDNRIAIVIPCHRVIGSDGSLVGYSGGVWRKRALLEAEAAAG